MDHEQSITQRLKTKEQEKEKERERESERTANYEQLESEESTYS